MTEKRFEMKVNEHNQCDIVDWVESKEKNAICIYNDLGDYYFSSAKALCELLNDLNDEVKSQSLVIKGYQERTEKLFNENEQLLKANKELKDTIIKITIAYQRKYDRTIVKLVNEVHDEDITDLIKGLQE